MNKIAETAREADGNVTCPSCEEELGDANIRTQNSNRILGGTGGVWGFIEVKCKECGAHFEVGGPVSVTKLPEDM